MNGPRWTAPELEQLASLAGDYPLVSVCRRYAAWAAAHGYPCRHPRGILRAGHRRGIVFRPRNGETLTTEALMAVLGWPSQAIRRQLLPAAAGRPKQRRYITRIELRNLARSEPQRFNGATRDQLFTLLEDADLADQVAGQINPQRRTNPRPVRCIETGKIYPSVTQAAREAFVHRKHLHRSLSDGRPVCGFHWEYV